MSREEGGEGVLGAKGLCKSPAKPGISPLFPSPAPAQHLSSCISSARPDPQHPGRGEQLPGLGESFPPGSPPLPS